MSHLPSPDATARSVFRAAIACSRRSTASEVEKIVFRQRESTELDDAAIEQLRDTMRDLQNKGEEEVKIKLGAYIIPGYSSSSDKRLEIAKDGLIRVATNQAAAAATGAIASNVFIESMSRGPGLDAANAHKPLFFSVAMDQKQTADTNQYTFHHEELRMLPLKYGDCIQVLQGALKNIYDYAVGDHLKLIFDALDEYRDKIITKDNADTMKKPQTEAEPRAPPLPPRRKKGEGSGGDGSDCLAVQAECRHNQRPGVRTRRTAHLVNPK
ncbi:MAG: hypothetical protein Q9209_005952 [Squamulea sp. 1 TL-2023]